MSETPVKPPQPEKPKLIEKIPEPLPKAAEKVPDVKEEPIIADVDDSDVSPVINRVNPKPKARARQIEDDEDPLPIFTRVAGVEKEKPLNGNDASLEKTGFIVAVRVAGLFLLYQAFIMLPDVIVLVSSALREHQEDISEMFTSSLIFPLARFLVYFVVGIYLIASGRILIWLLPDR